MSLMPKEQDKDSEALWESGAAGTSGASGMMSNAEPVKLDHT